MWQNHVVSNDVRLTVNITTHPRRRAAAHVREYKCNVVNLVECDPVLDAVTKRREAQLRILCEGRPAQALEAIKQDEVN